MNRLNAVLVPALVALTLLIATPTANAEAFAGRLNGHDCAERGTACPIDRLDPHLALEADFVLQAASGDYYFLVNLPREVKLRYVLEAVEITGEVNRRYNAITVDEFKVRGRVVWSQAMADEAREWSQRGG